ncbi:MAG: Transcriptional regulator, MarR family [Candidatus Saccharibacteria bacterium]|nr:Transcriptional regulator, MarR family [Candidatus Saccharibacteria bacterium]
MSMKATLEKQQATLICDDLMSLITVCKQHLNQIAKEHGLTSIQLFALHAIFDGNNATGKIAHILHCDASNVTGIIDRLTTLNLVTRKEDPQDRRVKTVQLTDEGQTVVQNATELLPVRLGCDRLTQQETEILHSTIAKLTLSN